MVIRKAVEIISQRFGQMLKGKAKQGTQGTQDTLEKMKCASQGEVKKNRERKREREREEKPSGRQMK